MSREKRRFTRVPFQVEAELKVHDLTYRTQDVSNLSVGGCLLHINADVEVAAKCHLKLWLGGTSGEITVSMEGEIVRSTPEATALM